jgi:NAD dependent epimerase/dehydratase family enzyme
MNPEARGVYNVTDGSPMSSTEFMERLARIAHLPPPPQVPMEEAQLTFSDQRLSFINESRRISNERMLKHLGVVLRYADVDEGIRASLSASG